MNSIQSSLDLIDKFNESNLERIATAEYPTVWVHKDDDGKARIDWWIDETGDKLEEAFFEAIEHGTDADLNAASAALNQHEAAIIEQTLFALRKSGTAADLAELIDAAAEVGSAIGEENSAGRFLSTIAKLAFERIQQGGSHHV
ncbi:hypothetical protein [Thiohalocapsa marina]|uniref:hypothetical protein n=1 Tax=Thiohalocapsa marina TaxID=424902 RepID=UPI0036DC3B5C